jgi:predicted RNase H-like nuclease (RuvC/YqgF family)
MPKNDSYAGQLIDENKKLKEENEKLKRNYEDAIRNLAGCRQDYEERTTEVLKLERRIQKLAENPYNSYALCLCREIEQLNSQIDKMKNCNNCKNQYTAECDYGKHDDESCNWQLKE